MNLKPLHDRLIVQPDNQDESTTKSGIIVPGGINHDETIEGVVIACGPGRTTEKGILIPMSVKPGDRVVVKRVPFEQTTVDDQLCLIMREQDVVAVQGESAYHNLIAAVKALSLGDRFRDSSPQPKTVTVEWPLFEKMLTALWAVEAE